MLATSSAAHAQTWLSDRKRAEGPGIRVGDLEIHPGLGAEFGYNSNIYNAEGDDVEGGEPEVGTAALRVSPHLFLSTLTGERANVDEGEGNRLPGFVQFTGGLSATLEHYFADAAPEGPEIGTNIDLRLTLAPERPVSFSVSEYFNRSFRAFGDPSTDPEAGESDNFVRYTESAAARVMGQTSGGLLQGGLGYRFTYNWFDAEEYSENNNLQHAIDHNGAWKFFPNSALFYDVSYTYQNYTNNDEEDLSPAGDALQDNDQVNARLGFNGAISPRIAATIAAGYAVGFFDEGDYEGLTLNAEGRWTPTPISEWALGFERSYASAYQGNFVRRHNIYTRLRMFFGGAFVLTSRLGLEFLDFGPSILDEGGPDGDDPRSDIRYYGDISGEYRFVDWLAVTGQLSAVRDDSDYVATTTFVNADGDDVTELDPVEYTTFEAWFGLRAFY